MSAYTGKTDLEIAYDNGYKRGKSLFVLSFALGLLVGLALSLIIVEAKAITTSASVKSTPENQYTNCVQQCKNLYLK